MTKLGYWSLQEINDSVGQSSLADKSALRMISIRCTLSPTIGVASVSGGLNIFLFGCMVVSVYTYLSVPNGLVIPRIANESSHLANKSKTKSSHTKGNVAYITTYRPTRIGFIRFNMQVGGIAGDMLPECGSLVNRCIL